MLPRRATTVPTVPAMRLVPLADVDLDALHAAQHRTEVADGNPFPVLRGEFDELLEEPHFDPAVDGVVAMDGDRIVGWARVFHEPSGERLERAFLKGGTVPEHRGEGIGTVLLDWQVARGAELLGRHDHGLPRYLRTFEYTNHRGPLDLFEAHGFTAVRWFHELLRGLDPIEAPTPVAIVPWDPDRAEAARLVHNAAFADHWGSTPVDAASWRAWVSLRSSRLDLSWMALEGDTLVGYALNAHYPDDEATTGRRDGWIGSLGVLAEHRRRGIASGLIARSIDAFADAGLTHAILGVDSSNETGAHGLYRRLGFEPLHEAVTHELAVG